MESAKRAKSGVKEQQEFYKIPERFELIEGIRYPCADGHERSDMKKVI